MGNHREVKVHSIDELKNFALQWVTEEKKPRQILLLSGPMGVGKTQLVSCIAEAMGLEEASSPSFALLHSYEGGEISLEHIDLYRLEDEDDLETTGFWDLFERDKGLIVVEWADRLAEESLPLGWEKTRMSMSFGDSEGERVLVLQSF